MQQQQLMQMQQPIMAGQFTANSITTDHIQQYLDENKSLILKILDNQNSGKHSECAENQARLQRNLMYLAAIADCQPQPSSICAQSMLMQPGTNYMQHQQSQQSVMTTRSPMLYTQQQPYSTLQQQQQAFQSQIGIGSALSSRVHMLQSEETSGDRVAVASPRNKENGSPSSHDSQRHGAGKGESM